MGGIEVVVLVVADERVGYVASFEEEGGWVVGAVLELEARYLLIHSSAAMMDGWRGRGGEGLDVGFGLGFGASGFCLRENEGLSSSISRFMAASSSSSVDGCRAVFASVSSGAASSRAGSS